MPPSYLLRAYQRIARPLDRWRIRERDDDRLRRVLEDFVPSGRLPVFIVVVPRTLGWLEPCLKLIPPEVPLMLIANGLSPAEVRRLEERFPARPVFRLSVLPHSFAKHGTVLDLLVAASPGDFAILDHDCYVFDRTLFSTVRWRENEFLGGVDEPGFFTVNEGSGLRFPRTHFLILRRERFAELGSRFGVGCEKALSTPRAVRGMLDEIGIGNANFPPVHMKFYDTLQLAMAVAFALGWQVHHLPVSGQGIAHIGGTARESQGRTPADDMPASTDP